MFLFAYVGNAMHYGSDSSSSFAFNGAFNLLIAACYWTGVCGGLRFFFLFESQSTTTTTTIHFVNK